MPSPTTIKGEIACAKFDLRAIEKGAIVSRPQIECDYDRIVDWKGKLYKVQIKYAGAVSKNGSTWAARCHLERIGHDHRKSKSYGDEIDIVAAYLPQVDKICWIGSDIFKGHNNIFIRYEPPKNGIKSGFHLLADFEW